MGFRAIFRPPRPQRREEGTTTDESILRSPAVGLMKIGDFTATPRMIGLAMIAIAIGVLGSFVALALLRLIDLCTNLFYFHRLSFEAASPSDNTLGVFAVA